MTHLKSVNPVNQNKDNSLTLHVCSMDTVLGNELENLNFITTDSS